MKLRISKITDVILKHKIKAIRSSVVEIGLDLKRSFLAAKDKQELRLVRILERGLMVQPSAHPDFTLSVGRSFLGPWNLLQPHQYLQGQVHMSPRFLFPRGSCCLDFAKCSVREFIELESQLQISSPHRNNTHLLGSKCNSEGRNEGKWPGRSKLDVVSQGRIFPPWSLDLHLDPMHPWV